MYRSADLWCGRDLNPLYQHSPPTAKHLSSPRQAGGDRQVAHDVRLLLFLVPVICLFSPRLTSMPISLGVVSFWTQKHRTLMYNLKTSNIFSLRPPLLVLGCPTPACPKDQVVAWCPSVHSVCASSHADPILQSSSADPAALAHPARLGG